MALNCCEEISMQAKATTENLKKAKMTTKILCICKLCSAYVNGKAVVDISQQIFFFGLPFLERYLNIDLNNEKFCYVF